MDIGCGPGQQTIELARISGGEVIGIDTDLSAVFRLQKHTDQANAGDCIKVIHASLFDSTFSVVASIESDPDRSDCGIYLLKRMDGYDQQ